MTQAPIPIYKIMARLWDKRLADFQERIRTPKPKETPHD